MPEQKTFTERDLVLAIIEGIMKANKYTLISLFLQLNKDVDAVRIVSHYEEH